MNAAKTGKLDRLRTKDLLRKTNELVTSGGTIAGMAYAVVGAGLVSTGLAIGARRKRALGGLVAAIGGASLVRAAQCLASSRKAVTRGFGKSTISLSRSPSDVYGFCLDLRNLQSIVPAWVMPPGPGETAESSSAVLESRPDELLVWRAINEEVETLGRMEFHPSDYGRSTSVELCLWRRPPEKKLGADVQQQVEESLRRLKAVLESSGMREAVPQALDDSGWAPESGEPAETGVGAGRWPISSPAGDDVSQAAESADRIVDRSEQQSGPETERFEENAAEFRVEEGSEESFPASDAPSWTPGRS